MQKKTNENGAYYQIFYKKHIQTQIFIFCSERSDFYKLTETNDIINDTYRKDKLLLRRLFINNPQLIFKS